LDIIDILKGPRRADRRTPGLSLALIALFDSVADLGIADVAKGTDRNTGPAADTSVGIDSDNQSGLIPGQSSCFTDFQAGSLIALEAGHRHLTAVFEKNQVYLGPGWKIFRPVSAGAGQFTVEATNTS
jgi:hypothetical protein